MSSCRPRRAVSQASLAEQFSGPSAGAALRDSARRKRFVVLWQRILDDVAMTDVERCRKWLVRHPLNGESIVTMEKDEGRNHFGDN